MGGGSAWGALAGIESGFASIASSALWKHLRATNVVESPFASVRLRTTAAKRPKGTAPTPDFTLQMKAHPLPEENASSPSGCLAADRSR